MTAPTVERVTAVQEARARIARLLEEAMSAAEAAGRTDAAVEYADADLMLGRPTGTQARYRAAADDARAAHAASAKARTELDAAIADALTFGPLAEQDALPARSVLAPRLAWEDRTTADDLAAEAADARTEALR